MEEKLVTKDDLLNKLRAYSDVNDNPDDDNIVYKQKSKMLFYQTQLSYMLSMKRI